MKVLGIIAEYNPFHNGHIYHIQKAKELTNTDYVVAVMSGNFTEQGNISIYNKFERAKIATNNGIDLVIELPTIYANSSSNFFAKGAISILNSLNIVDSICFGTEANDIKILKNISNTIITNEEKIWKDISENLKLGISFAKAREQSISKYLSLEEIQEFSKPNNILAIEYLNNLSRLNSNITPYGILRNSSNFNDTNITDTSNFTSATSIRNYIYNNSNLSKLNTYIPDDMMNIIKNVSPTFNDLLINLIKYKVITTSKEHLANIQDVTEGLENKIFSAISNVSTYNVLINNIKSKRYQMSKIKRMLNNIILDISKDDFNTLVNSNEYYAHVLSISKRGKILLSEISKNSSIPLITSINDTVIKSLYNTQQKMLKLDILSSNIHSILNNNDINMDYTNRL